MEKKNVIFLSVIAVATLLTAVIGTTFAYFTANYTTTNTGNATTEVTTAAMPTITFDYGSNVGTTDKVYPGYSMIKPMKLDVSCSETTCEPTYIKISVTNASTVTASDLTWALYESTSDLSSKYTCSNTVTTGTALVDGVSKTTYYMSGNDTCVASSLTDAGATMLLDSTTKSSDTISVSKASDSKYYYLVVNYANNDATQNTDYNKTISVTMSAVETTK